MLKQEGTQSYSQELTPRSLHDHSFNKIFNEIQNSLLIVRTVSNVFGPFWFAIYLSYRL